VTDYRESRDGLSLRWQLEKDIPKRVRESMASEVTLLLARMHEAHPAYVFCLSMECWGRKMPPTMLTANSQESGPPCGST
jgi:hypothetical protein